MKSQRANVETWKRRAKHLLRHCDVEGYFRIDNRGVWPEEPWDTIGDDGKIKKLGRWRNSPDGNIGDVFGQWRPARVLAAKGCEIDPADTPALPFPFDAKKLAAFMMNGMGAFVAEWYCDGDWDNGLSIEALEQSIPVDEVWLRQTVREAVDAYRTAKDAIGCPDGEHPDPDEIVWQLLKPDDASAAPPTGQQDAPACTASGASVQPKAKLQRRTWWEVSSHYIVEVMRAGQHGTAKSLYLDLERKAGPESPFDRGTGDNRGNLFVREIAQSLSLKTVQNEWGRLRELLQQSGL